MDARKDTPKRRADQVKSVHKRRRALKQMAVDLLGSKCWGCGYDACIAAMEFHHLDPSQKDFAMSVGTRSWERIKAEALKCALLCANCHREVHAGLRAIR